MAIELVQSEIQLFLAADTPGVLILSGKWGVGKTYSWNYFLRLFRNSIPQSFKSYSYVSLFGIGNIEEIRTSIFQNTIDVSNIGKPADLDTFETTLRSARMLWRQGGKIGKLLPFTEKYSLAFERLGFLWMSRQIVCLDDLERKGGTLAVADVLGLASFLKEQRNCKVILLFNEDYFDKESKQNIQDHLEKVNDVFLKFTPTPREAAEIGLFKDKPFYDLLLSNCLILEIVNIRTIHKIQSMAQRLYNELKEFDERVMWQGLHTLSLLVYAKLQPSDAPSLDFIMRMNEQETLAQQILGNNEESPEQQVWRTTLNIYDFRGIDSFDAIISKFVSEGHLDATALKKEAITLEDRLKATDNDTSFRQAWNLYHDSFEDNADVVAAALIAAVRNNPAAVSPTNLSSTITLLKDLGHGGEVNQLIQLYVESLSNQPREFWDLANSTFGSEVKDPDVRIVFEEKLSTFQKPYDPEETLYRLARGQGWNPDEIAALAELSSDDFIEIFKSTKGDRFRRIVRGALWFKKSSYKDDHTDLITSKVITALQVIAKESTINKRRVAQLGIEIGVEIIS